MNIGVILAILIVAVIVFLAKRQLQHKNKDVKQAIPESEIIDPVQPQEFTPAIDMTPLEGDNVIGLPPIGESPISVLLPAVVVLNTSQDRRLRAALARATVDESALKEVGAVFPVTYEWEYNINHVSGDADATVTTSSGGTSNSPHIEFKITSKATTNFAGVTMVSITDSAGTVFQYSADVNLEINKEG